MHLITVSGGRRVNAAAQKHAQKVVTI
jgi:hypothetical protein